MNLHRRGKTVCPHITEHFNLVAKSISDSIQIIKVLSGNGNDRIGFENKNIRRLRLGRDNFWMKTLSSNFSYGLNESSEDLMPGEPVGINFYDIWKYVERNNRCQKKPKQTTFYKKI